MAIKFIDRGPTYPNRIKFTAEDGTVKYGVWERADSPTVVGTPINAANLNAMQQNTGLSSNRVMYVSTAGSDNTGDGTQNTPYATISKALSTLPKNLNGYDVTIHIAGGVYNENVTIQRFSSGTIILTGILNENVQINTFAVMSKLDRQECGLFTTNNAVELQQFMDCEDISSLIIPPDEVIAFDKLILTENQSKKLLNGVFDEVYEYSEIYLYRAEVEGELRLIDNEAAVGRLLHG